MRKRQLQIHSVYRHYKGNFYYVKGVAKHTENYEDLVIYHSLHDEGEVYARPIDMFLSEVEEGVVNPTGQEYRFELADLDD